MDYKEGYQLTIDNATALMQVSQQAAESKNYGVACSLNILAAEEAVKAFCLLILSYKPEEKIEKYKALFSNHKVKHNVVKGLAAFSEEMYKKTKDFRSDESGLGFCIGLV